jgi:hypothetical protein
MRATFRPLPAWPYASQPTRHATFRVSYARTLADLEREIGYLRGREVIIGLVTDESQVRLDGMIRADARINQPGVELSFEKPDGTRLVFHTDVHKGYGTSWQDNLRAIALGLEALRAVDRYGITSTAEQYAGFAQLTSGGPDAGRGKRLVEERFDGSIAAALRGTHPDTRRDGYTDRDFADVQAYRTQTEPRLPAGAGA